MLSDFVLDTIYILTVVEILEYTRDLIVCVHLLFLIERLWTSHLLKNIRSKLSKDIEQIATTASKNNTMAFIRRLGVWIYQCNVRQFVIAKEVAQFGFSIEEHLMPSIKVSVES